MNRAVASVHLDVPSSVAKNNATVQPDLSCPLPEGLNALVCDGTAVVKGNAKVTIHLCVLH